MVLSSQSNSDLMITLDNVTKKYPDGTIGIKNLSLQIQKGEIFGFLGQNGAGKTTCIRCILNILIPDEGKIIINNQEVSRKTPQIKEQIGYLPGELNIPGYYSVHDFIDYMANLRSSPAIRLDEIASKFELPLDKKVSELSKGNKQKIGLVIALMTDPDILILDEPTSGLDPIFQQLLYDLLIREKNNGKTIFFSSHNLDEVQKICDRVGIIREGTLVSVERVDELSDKIPRYVTLSFDVLSQEVIDFCKTNFDVFEINHQLGDIRIEVSSFDNFRSIIDQSKELSSIQDIIYPPASLESYFMKKYKEG